MAALVLIARAQLRRHLGSLLLIGVLAGLTGGTVVAALSVARRTATAEDRLAVQTNADDVRSTVVGGDRETTQRIVDPVLTADEVERGRLAIGGVARVDGPGVVYVSVIAGPSDWGGDVLSPVLVDGRLPDPEDPYEVVINQALLTSPQGTDIDIGDRYLLHLLTAEELARFDATTPLEGEGGDLPVTIVGTIRLPGSPDDLPPLWASPALADLDLEGLGTLGGALVQLRPGVTDDEFTTVVNQASDDARRAEALSDFPAISVDNTATRARSSTKTTTNVLTTGLLALAAVAGVMGVIVVAQAAFRQEEGSRENQRIEAAIGVPRSVRVRARVLAAAPAALLAAAFTVGAGLLAGRIEPPGVLGLAEPQPGSAPNFALVAVATVVCPVVVLALGAIAAIRRPRRPGAATRESPFVRWVSNAGGRPPAVLGLRFALERSSGAGGVSARTAIVTLGLAVGGLVAALVFASSLDRLVDTPVRWGSPTDLVISDADAEDNEFEALRDDERFDLVVRGGSAELLLEGRTTVGVAQEAVLGDVEWELESGRPPATPDEIVLGTRLADDLDKSVGDVIEARDREGDTHRLSVIGIGVLPTFGNEDLGRNAALTREGLERVAAANPFPELGLGVRPGVSRQAVLEELARDYEVSQAELPREVANLKQIDRVPLAIAGFLGLLAITTLVHTISVVTRRRTRDLATARAIGFTRTQGAAAIVTASGGVAIAGSVVALLVGVVVGRLLWRLVAEGAGVVDHMAYPMAVLVGLVPISLLVAIATAGVTSRRALRGPTSDALRAE